MSYLSLGNYNDEVGNISSQYNTLLSKADEIYNVKEKANKMVENIGGIKAFISGKPISKYLISKGKAGLKSAFEKAGADLKNARSEFQAGKDGISQISKTDSIMGRFGSQLNTEGTALPDVVATPIAEGVALPDVIASPISSALPDVIGSPITSSGSYADSAVARIMGNGGLQRNLRPPTPQNLQPPNEEDSGILKQGTEETENVEKVAKADEQYDKSLAKDDRGNGEKGEEEEEEGEEEGDIGGDAAEGAVDGAGAALDAIPGPTEVIGLILGAGMAIYGAIHKPKEQTPVDKINASYQVGE